MIGFRDEDLVARAMLQSDVPPIYEACIYVVIDQRNEVVWLQMFSGDRKGIIRWRINDDDDLQDKPGFRITFSAAVRIRRP